MLKPSPELISANYTILGYDSYGYGWTPDVVFDDSFGDTSYSTTLILGYPQNYISFKVTEKFYFWFASGPSYLNSFNLIDLNTNTIIDVIQQPNTAYTWSKYAVALNAGEYKLGRITDTIISALFFEKINFNKFLIEENSNIKTWNGSMFENIGVPPATLSMFETYGMSSLEDVDFTTLTNPNNIVIKKYTTDLDEEPILNVTALPFNTALIFPDGDINISDVGTLNYVNLTATTSGNGIVKVIVSFDSGVTWYGYDTVNEEFIEVTNLTEESEYIDILSYGMTTTELSSTGISKEEWENIRPHSLDLDKQVIRFAYLLSIQSATDDAYVDNIALNVDMKGTWSPAIYTDQFIYAYTNYKLNIKIKESGTYKINYYYRGPAFSTVVDSFNDLIDKPERFLPTLHTHSISDVFNLQTTLDNKSDITHTHDMLHTHTSKPALDLISVDTNTGDPLWRGDTWPGNIAAENIIDSFIKQYDTPNTYSGNENKLIKVKADRTGLEFVEIHTATNSTSEITGSQLARRYAILYGRD